MAENEGFQKLKIITYVLSGTVNSNSIPNNEVWERVFRLHHLKTPQKAELRDFNKMFGSFALEYLKISVKVSSLYCFWRGS